MAKKKAAPAALSPKKPQPVKPATKTEKIGVVCKGGKCK